MAGVIGQRPTMHAVTDRGLSALVTLDAELLPADRTPLDAALLREKLDRLGETPFTLRDVSIGIEGAARIAPASINRARRELVESLERQMRGFRHATTSASTHLSLIHI